MRATSAVPGVRRPGAHAPSRGNDRRARMKKHIKAVDAQGRKLGGETPLLCTPLVGRTRERLLAEAASVLRQKPDIVEWRVDFFRCGGRQRRGDRYGAGAAERRRQASCHLHPARGERRRRANRDRASIRSSSSTLQWQRRGWSTSSISRWTTIPSICAASAGAAQRHEIRLILSYHNLSYTPALDYLVDRFLEAERLGADVAMVQVHATRPRRRAAAACARPPRPITRLAYR